MRKLTLAVVLGLVQWIGYTDGAFGSGELDDVVWGSCYSASIFGTGTHRCATTWGIEAFMPEEALSCFHKVGYQSDPSCQYISCRFKNIHPEIIERELRIETNYPWLVESKDACLLSEYILNHALDQNRMVLLPRVHSGFSYSGIGFQFTGKYQFEDLGSGTLVSGARLYCETKDIHAPGELEYVSVIFDPKIYRSAEDSCRLAIYSIKLQGVAPDFPISNRIYRSGWSFTGEYRLFPEPPPLPVAKSTKKGKRRGRR